jgi:hypothetical protein
MNRLVAAHPSRELHVILDNLKHPVNPNTTAGWRATRTSIFTSPDPRLVAEPSRGLVLDPVRTALAGASFTSARQVREQIDAFLAAYNRNAHPLEWTKQVVFSQHPRSSYVKFTQLDTSTALVGHITERYSAHEDAIWNSRSSSWMTIDDRDFAGLISMARTLMPCDGSR